jgi:hypothetical protein
MYQPSATPFPFNLRTRPINLNSGLLQQSNRPSLMLLI